VSGPDDTMEELRVHMTQAWGQDMSLGAAAAAAPTTRVATCLDRESELYISSLATPMAEWPM